VQATAGNALNSTVDPNSENLFPHWTYSGFLECIPSTQLIRTLPAEETDDNPRMGNNVE